MLFISSSAAMARSIATASLILCFSTLSHGHALWEQNVLGDDRGVSTYFTFAEAPGLDHAERESMARKAYENSIKLHFADVSNSDEIEFKTLQPTLEGKYVTAKLPTDGDGEDAFVLEGYCNWGVFGEPGRFPPSLIHFYTSASRGNFKYNDVVEENSRNKLRVHLGMAEKSSDKCTDDENTHCIKVLVIFDMQPMPGQEVSFYLSKPSEVTEKVITDADGSAYLLVDKKNERIFAKVMHSIDTPGVTPYGDDYEAVKHIATTVLERSMSPRPDSYNDSDSNSSSIVGISAISPITILSVLSLVSFAASFFGSALSLRINPRHNYSVAGPKLEFA